MVKKESIEKIFAKLEVSGETLLMVMISRSGSVSRQGDGSESSGSRLLMGKTDEPLLDRFLKKLETDLLEFSGRYELPDPKGDPCVLTLAFEGENLDTGFEFRYGAASQGPPEEVLDLIEHAVSLTDPWYEEELSKKKRN